MEFNTDGTYKSYGFRDGMPFGGFPYYKSGAATGMSQEDEGVSRKALMLLQDRHGLSSERANNWLDTGDVSVGYDFGQHEQAPNILEDEAVGRGFMDELLGYGGEG
jgi:hypothetical protein